MNQDTWDVFISYTWGTRGADGVYVSQKNAREIRDSLERELGLRVWMDVTEMRHGPIHQVVTPVIRNTRLFLCMMTREYSNSQNCMSELTLSNEFGIPRFFYINEDVSNLSHKDIVMQLFGDAAYFLCNSIYYKEKNQLVEAVGIKLGQIPVPVRQIRNFNYAQIYSTRQISPILNASVMGV